MGRIWAMKREKENKKKKKKKKTKQDNQIKEPTRGIFPVSEIKLQGMRLTGKRIKINNLLDVQTK